MPNVAIIIPVYNVELYLDRCVKSIINQTFTDFSLILVDDGSPDFCPDMCDNWAKKDNRITVIHKQNQGLSAARNTGIEYAKSNGFQWIFFVDSDDWIHKKTIEVLYYAAIENNVSVACCNFIKTQGEPLEDILNTTVNIVSASDFYLNKNIIATVACAKLYRTECFRNIRYPVGKIHEDEFVTYKILFACDKIAY
ncbi:MAG: glycosyltransferase, partial [Clostridiales bacterium]|nr:glycosyltransferase [Clostridiales bacterium]